MYIYSVFIIYANLHILKYAYVNKYLHIYLCIYVHIHNIYVHVNICIYEE